MKKLIYTAVIVVFFLLALSFHLNNPQTVTLRYYRGIEQEMPLSVLLWITLIVGVIIGWFAGLIRSLKLRRRLARANREARNLEGEIV
jgi:uncharacterized integral membrane protein